MSGLNIGGEPRPVLPVTIGDEASFDRALALEWGDALFDVRHRFVVSFGAELPTPRGMGAVVEHLVGGWQLNGIVQKQTGFPLSVTDSALDIRFLTNRPDATCDPNDERAAHDGQWFNTSCFVAPPAGADRRAPGQRRPQHDPRPGLRVDRPVAVQERRARRRSGGIQLRRRGVQPVQPGALQQPSGAIGTRQLRPDHVGAGRPRDAVRDEVFVLSAESTIDRRAQETRRYPA